jgi:hypothetical protein
MFWLGRKPGPWKADGKTVRGAPSRGDVGPYADLRGPKLRNMVNSHLLVQLVCVNPSVGHVSGPWLVCLAPTHVLHCSCSTLIWKLVGYNGKVGFCRPDMRE